MFTAANFIAAVITLVPLVAAAFFGASVAAWAQRLPLWLRLSCPSILSVAYLLVACSSGLFRWSWFALYAVLPVAIAC